MSIFLSEFLGTAILIAFGNGVVANVVLNKTKGQNSGWIVIAFGWAIAVFAGVFVSAKYSGAHLNPAVTLALVYLKKISWNVVPQYLAGQLLGAMTGSVIVWLSYLQHYKATENAEGILATFATSPAVKSSGHNFLTEFLATFIFVLSILFIVAPSNSLGSLDALPVALLVLGIGLSFGGPTGYAINPVRDLGPRIVHQLLPITHKGGSEWKYALVPILGPLAGGLLAAIVFSFI
ncbi:aquaporin family protein [Ginsengibacter hankyongi]|uniref:Aquaporin family protein n=1 Tax=Ginsengibacter hankyongi TaxID=2607284 RepID=A0A5J5ICZ8_9BACT|nr:MIP/aquaporin family protein [Ginsengibacter hankyongi]KAA9037637.1 aquaporin family protein [Ginsengibacter hankyongi]